jgi:Ca2+-binding RTX toxin-like protein
MVIASLLHATPSFGAVSCSYSNADRLLTVTAADSFARIARFQEAIRIDDGHSPISCLGGPPTVFNTDRVQISHSGRRADIVDLTGGPFAPGAILEPEGTSEIEVEYVEPTFVNIRGTGAADRLSLGPRSAVNLNGDDDGDVSGPFTTLLIEGRAGDDLVSPQGDYSGTTALRVLLGGAGRDRVVAPPDGGILHGGNGRDLIIGGPAAENITGGRGNDVVRGGNGRDIIRAIDGTKDRISCGGGFDRVKADGVDRLNGCERLILIKRTEPVKRARGD